MKAKQTKRDRKLGRARRREQLMTGYRTQCRDNIAAMRQQKIPTGEFRIALKALRHGFMRAIAGRAA